MNKPELFSDSNQATYCPEDNKLRLYVGRVPRPEYEALRAEGWTSTPKQDCDFVAVWTIERENTALSYAGIIGDEDQSPTDRAADRAERFADYRDKRRADAGYQADRFEGQDLVHGNQSETKAERAAARHAATGARACNMWEKAEYWQSRTAGVISHALYLCKPSVRMGRIKEIETDMRRIEKESTDYSARRTLVLKCDTGEKIRYVLDRIRDYCDYKHPREPQGPEWSLSHWMDHAADPIIPTEAREMYLAAHPERDFTQGRGYQHLQLRLAYERQMIEAVGGMAGEETVEVGGRFNGQVVYKVNKSSVSGRITTIEVLSTEKRYSWRDTLAVQGYYFHTVDIERSTGGGYTAPEAGDLALVESIRAELAAKKKAGKVTIPLINPTLESARKLQAVLNAEYSRWSSNSDASDITEITQARYSANSGGSYAMCEATEFDAEGRRCAHTRGAVPAFKVRLRVRGNDGGASVIVLTDKPQKGLPELVPVAQGVTA
jgi:hypothetical protein